MSGSGAAPCLPLVLQARSRRQGFAPFDVLSRKLGMAVLAADVRMRKDTERRNAGEPIETPQSACASLDVPVGEQGGPLREAFGGRKKERNTSRKKRPRHPWAGKGQYAGAASMRSLTRTSGVNLE